jgi:hypothetical protein
MHVVFEYKQTENPCKSKQFLLIVDFEHEPINYYALSLLLYESMLFFLRGGRWGGDGW